MTKRTLATTITALVALAILAAACGRGGSSAAGPPGTAVPAGPTTAPRVGSKAPDFAVRTTEGNEFRLSAQRGRVVVLDFLAVGCPSCAREVASLKEVWGQFRSRGLVVLLIDISGQSAEDVVDYYRGSLGGGDHLYAADTEFRASALYKVLALGTTLVIDPDGTVTYLDSAPTFGDVLPQEVQKALR